MKVFVERKGRKRELTGWRKWAVAVPGLTLGGLVLAVAIIFAFGLAVTVGVILLFAVPAVFLLAGIAIVLGWFEMRADADDGRDDVGRPPESR